MAYLNADSFVFDGKSSDLFDVGIGWFKNDNDDIMQTGLEKELKRGDMNMVRTKPNHYGSVYDETLRFEFIIYPKRKQSFTWEESHAINIWLTHSNTPKLFHFNDKNSEWMNFYAVCTNVEDAVYSGLNAKKLTFVCDSPFGYTQETKKVLKTTGETADYKLNNLSDTGYYYPTIRIEVAGSFDGDLTIENRTENKRLVINFENIQETDNKKIVIMDGRRTQITNESGVLIPAYKIGWNNVDNIYWFRLVEGSNLVRVTGTSTITMYFEFPKKVGVV